MYVCMYVWMKCSLKECIIMQCNAKFACMFDWVFSYIPCNTDMDALHASLHAWHACTLPFQFQLGVPVSTGGKAMQLFPRGAGGKGWAFLS